MRSILDLLGRPRALAGAPAYVRRESAQLFGGAFGVTRSNREGQLASLTASGTLFAIVDRLAFTVSTAEWGLWTKSDSGKDEDRKPVTRHAALDVWNKPNDFFTRQELVEASSQHYELTGEWWNVVVKAGKLPIELWPIRPDRMLPQPSASKFLAGYWYLDPDGQKVPLALDEVLFLRRPSPLDPYRGISPVAAVMLDIDGGQAAREWNRNFFANSAEPGGIIESPERLADDEWTEFRTRWAESHRGVNNAHRVAILESGMVWKDRKYTRKDMEFVEGLNLTSEAIRTAWGFPKPLLGAVDDVNRANADAADTVFARWLVKPRLERIKGMLNNDFLPLFGPTAVGLEFDFVNPVPEDEEQANATLTARVNAAKVLVVDMHAERDSVMAALDLPLTITFEEMPEPQPPALPGAAPAAGKPASASALAHLWPADARRARNAVEVAAGIDLTQLQTDWERELDALVGRWRDVTLSQRADLKRQIRVAVDTGDVAALAELTADADDGGAVLAAAMLAMAVIGAASAAAEANAQGAVTEQGQPDEDELNELALAAAALLAAGLAGAAGGEALRRYRAGADPDELAGQVDTYLSELSESTLRARLGGMLTQAQNIGRMATMRQAPEATYYASEVLDKSTCKPCAKIDGQRLPTLDAAMLAYGGSGYLFCEGTWRCRGTMIAVYNDEG
jgi:HK97 family phage portal protein